MPRNFFGRHNWVKGYWHLVQRGHWATYSAQESHLQRKKPWFRDLICFDTVILMSQTAMFKYKCSLLLAGDIQITQKYSLFYTILVFTLFLTSLLSLTLFLITSPIFLYSRCPSYFISDPLLKHYLNFNWWVGFKYVIVWKTKDKCFSSSGCRWPHRMWRVYAGPLSTFYPQYAGGVGPFHACCFAL